MEIDVPAKVRVLKGTSAGKKSTNKKPTDYSKSNKAIIYTAWKSGTEDITKLHKKVEGRVKETTIKIWLSMWAKGKGLPAIANK
jgi:hypothetical protein